MDSLNEKVESLGMNNVYLLCQMSARLFRKKTRQIKKAF